MANFSSLFSTSNYGNANFLSDWSSIRNGSYYKLLKWHYNYVNDANSSSSGNKSKSGYVLDQILEERKHPTASKEVQEANSTLTTSISSLKNSISTLQKDDTYKASDDGTSATDKVVSAIKDYVAQYNDVVNAAKKSTLTNKTSHIASMMNATKANADKLAGIGITINQNGTLQLNENQLKTTEISKVQDLFSNKDIMSYGSTVASRLNFASISSGVSSSGATEETKKEEEVQDDTASTGAAASLKTDIADLTSASLYEKIKGEDGEEQYDIDRIFAAAKSFASNYNNMLDAAGLSFNSGVSSNLAQIKAKTAQNKSMLEQFGISVDGKGKMKINEDAFKGSDMAKVQKFFKSYGSSIATNVSLVNYYMTTQAGASNNYTANGTYNVQGGFRFDTAF